MCQVVIKIRCHNEEKAMDSRKLNFPAVEDGKGGTMCQIWNSTVLNQLCEHFWVADKLIPSQRKTVVKAKTFHVVPGFPTPWWSHLSELDCKAKGVEHVADKGPLWRAPLASEGMGSQHLRQAGLSSRAQGSRDRGGCCVRAACPATCA